MKATMTPMQTAAMPAALIGAASQPNEIDLRRIARRLTGRARYRYVAPEVRPLAGGYQIVAPCCSRNIDAAGGVIDIARIEYDEAERRWNLYYKDHASDCWSLFIHSVRLERVMDSLNEDPLRVFWQ
jgi:hypothetical protein